MKPSTDPVFTWTGTDRAGNTIQGEIVGKSPTLVKAVLRVQGIQPTRVRKKSPSLFGEKNPRITPKDITVFSRQLATLISSGVPLVQGLDIVTQSTENPRMRALSANIRADIAGGNTLADSLAKHPKYFDDLVCSLIRSGEKSGALDTMLDRLALYQEKSHAMEGKIKKAATYPVSVVVIALIISTILLLYVVPQFEQLFTNFGAELPAFTQATLNLSHLLQESWHLIFGGVILATIAFLRALRRSPTFARRVDRRKLQAPILGDIFTKAAVSRYARTLSTMFAAGVPLVDAMEQVAGATGNLVYNDAILRMRDDVAAGQRLNVAMNKTGLFPPMAVQMICVGEESGALDNMLEKVADYYEQEVDDAIDGLSTLMEPMIMAFLGIVLGGLILAMYLPVFSMGGAI